MTALVVRKIAWEFDDSVPFMWQPKNPSFGLFCNAFTFIAVPFERYIVSAVRKAQDKLSEDRYRVKHFRATSHHVAALAQAVAETFDRVVPFEDRGASTRELMSKGLMTRELKYRLPWKQGRRDEGPPSIFQDVPSNQLAKMVWRLWLSQTPYHDPADQPLPEWADTWMAEYDRGTDMTRFFGSFGPPDTAEG